MWLFRRAFVIFGSFIAFTLMTIHSARREQSNTARVNIPTMPLCELLEDPVQYSGKTVNTAAMESAFLSNYAILDRSACLGFGFALRERVEIVARGRGCLQGLLDRLT
jgi:hypothetical protein